MDGRNHYEEAEKLLSRSNPPDATVIALAQVHATLALAAGFLSQALHEPGLAGRTDPGSLS